MPSLPPIYASIGVNNALRNKPLEPNMTRYWKNDFILIIGYSSIAAVLVFAAL